MRELTCNSCDATFDYSSGSAPFDKFETFFKCDGCKKVFGTLNGIDAHQAMSARECGDAGHTKIEICLVCERRIEAKGDIRKHHIHCPECQELMALPNREKIVGETVAPKGKISKLSNTVQD